MRMRRLWPRFLSPSPSLVSPLRYTDSSLGFGLGIDLEPLGCEGVCWHQILLASTPPGSCFSVIYRHPWSFPDSYAGSGVIDCHRRKPPGGALSFLAPRCWECVQVAVQISSCVPVLGVILKFGDLGRLCHPSQVVYSWLTRSSLHSVVRSFCSLPPAHATFLYTSSGLRVLGYIFSSPRISGPSVLFTGGVHTSLRSLFYVPGFVLSFILTVIHWTEMYSMESEYRILLHLEPCDASSTGSWS
jgi:hypothetical protein